MSNSRAKDTYEFVESSVLDGKTVYLTDARRVGVMLRDKRFTLRANAALSEFLFESVGGNDFVMKSLDMGDEQNAYVKFGDKEALSVDAARDRAEKVQVRVTELGLVLCVLDGQRPAVYDHFNDVSIGKPGKGRSTIFVLVHLDGPAQVYAPFNNAVGGGTVDPDGGALGGGVNAGVDANVGAGGEAAGNVKIPIQEGNPGQTQPAVPGQNQPASPGQTQPSYPGDTQPPKPGQNKPSYPNVLQPLDQILASEPGQVQPSEPGQVQPSEPSQVQPSEPGQVQPLEPGQTQPSESDYERPATQE